MRSGTAKRNRRARKRKSEGYVGTGPVDIPSDLVQVMIDMGDLDAGDVKWDEAERPQVDLEVMNEAWPRFLERVAVKADDLPDFLSENSRERKITSPLFCQEIGLPTAAPRMAFDTVVRAAEDHGYEVRIIKKRCSERKNAWNTEKRYERNGSGGYRA